MTSYQRTMVCERGEIDLKTGAFPMVLASSGEAADGDILSIEGSEFPDRAPLQLSHINDPTSTLGTIEGFHRDLQSSPRKLRALGRVELGGEGLNADIRRDVAYMISQGHVTGISVRWNPIKYTPRVQLPKGHFAHVGDGERDVRKRVGLYHEKWRVLEGSVVAVQADAQAMIGRAEETEGHVAEFWRAMAATSRAPSLLDELAVRVAALEDAVVTLAEAEPPPEDPQPPTFAERMDAMGERIASDFRAYFDWRRGAVLDPAGRAAAARIRERIEKIRASERRRC